jgi:hypothetical protein
MYKITSIIITTIVLLVAFSSCKKDSDSITGNEKEKNPSVSTDKVSNITTDSATIQGTILSNGIILKKTGKLLTSGFTWSEKPNPMVKNDHKTSKGPLLGKYSSTISGLKPSTKYFVRAYASNDAGTGYGDDISFTTLTPTKTYTDNFDRPDVGPVDESVTPNPIGDWTILQNNFSIDGHRLSGHGTGGGFIIYSSPGTDYLQAGNGHSFTFGVDVSFSAGNFAGLVFNAQEPDGKNLYVLRFNEGGMQILKGDNFLLSLSGIIFLDAAPPDNIPFQPETTYHVEISSTDVGEFHVFIKNISTKDVLFDQTLTDDDNPLSGGAVGFYYGGFSGPVDVYYDNFSLVLKK